MTAAAGRRAGPPSPEALSPLLPVRLGLTRGWIAFRSMITSREGFTQNLVWNAIPLAVLILNRDSTIPGTDIPFGVSLLPGLLAVTIVFSVMGTAYYLTSEREDGTLLRAKALPQGMTAYVVGLSVVGVLDTVTSLLVVLLPGMFIVPGVPVGSAVMWFGLIGYLLLGLLACLPLGILIGSVVRSPRTVGGVGFVATMGLAVVSGLFFPLQALWSWVQVGVQLLPMYWLGIGLRSVFLPPEAAAQEIGESWRTLDGVLVLGAWAAVGLLLGPVLLRRMARRESGSAVEARRQQALQRT
jgi:ABC-2 type transport system permease protein